MSSEQFSSPGEPGAAELREARLEIVRLQRMIAELAKISIEDAANLSAARSRETVLQQQIRDLRGSLSWRMTRPVRMTSRLVKISARERGED